MSYNMITKGGHSFYEVASAIQKYVRRGDEHKALYWFSELFISGYDEYGWKRIKVMMSEDIGIANPNLPAQINALYETFVEMKKQKNKHCPEKLPYVHAVMLLVRSPKSRLVDNKLCQYFDLRSNIPTPEFDDYVFCLHTLKGKFKKRGNKHFYDEAALITNEPAELIKEEYQYRDFVAQQYYDRDDATAPKPKDEVEEQITLF